MLLDIEGTTTPIDFVYKTLFPYARAHVKDYLASHRFLQSNLDDIAGLIKENADDAKRGLVPPLLEGPAQNVSIDAIDAMCDG
jgi:enolase-phosphatase E1